MLETETFMKCKQDQLNNEGKNRIEFQKNDENSHDILALAKDKIRRLQKISYSGFP